MVRYTFRGTHRGEYLGLPPTGQPVTYAGIYIFRIVNGHICEMWDIFDRQGCGSS